MNRYTLSFFLWLFFFLTNLSLQASSLDGTSSIIYKTTPQVFHNGEFARGFVALENGFTVPPISGVFLDILMPIKTFIDLRETGSIELQNNVTLDTGLTLSSGGIISGNGFSLFLNGDLNIPDNSVIRIKTDTIINGNGNDLIFGKRSKIFVDSNITLTLKNMCIIQTLNDISDPCIKLTTFGSKLAFQDVNISLANDFLFAQGSMYIHGDVAITGTSAFIYRSTQQSFIAPNSTFYFDVGSTFSVAPATFTDCRFDQKPTHTTNNFIIMEDTSSKLYFNEASLLATQTGCRLTKGLINFENKCLLKSNASANFDPSFTGDVAIQVGGNSSTGSSPQSISWSPGSKFMAVVNSSANTLQIFSFNGSSTPTQIGSNAATGTAPYSVDWSNDGKFLAVVNNTSNTLQIFSFNGIGTPTQIGSNVTTGTAPISVKWSTTGKFVAVVNANSNTLQIYSFNGVATPYQIGSNAGTGIAPSSVDWSCDGRYLAVVNSSSNTLQIFTFNGTSTPTQIGGDMATGTYPACVKWSPDSRFLAVACKNSNYIQMFSFNGANTPVQVGSNTSTETNPVSLTWTVDGRFIIVANYGSNTFEVFNFDQATTPVKVGISSTTTGTNPVCISCSLDGAFISVVNSGSNTLQVFKLNFTSYKQPQAKSNGILFGNSKLGTSYDTTINLLANSNVFIDGLVCYDCIN